MQLTFAWFKLATIHSGEESITLNVEFVIVIILILFYAYLNGFDDSGGLVAAAISSLALSPRRALWSGSF